MSRIQFRVNYNLYNHSFTINMVKVANPWSIYGYHGLTIVTMFFCGFYSKTMVNFRKGLDAVLPDS